MHLAFENLTPQQAIWRNLGLKYLLDPATEIRKEPVSQTLAAGQIRNYGPAYKKADSVSISVDKEPIRPLKPGWRNVPEQDWPEIWRKQLKKTKPGKICWLYWKLGLDLNVNNPDQNEKLISERKNRREFLLRLFKDLAMPVGTHTFWPPVLHEMQKENIISRDLFLSIMQKMRCRYFVLFGSLAAKILLPDFKLEPLRQYMLSGHVIWILRDIDVLMNRKDYYRSSLDYLRRQITQHPSLQKPEMLGRSR